MVSLSECFIMNINSATLDMSIKSLVQCALSVPIHACITASMWKNLGVQYSAFWRFVLVSLL